MDSGSHSVRAEVLLEQMGWVRALARGLLADEHAAEDVAQDALAKALERSPRPPVSEIGLRAWLARVTRTLARQDVRSRRRRLARELAADSPKAEDDAAERVARGEMHRLLVQAVLELDEPERSTVLARYLDGLSAPEIAARRGESQVAVRKRLSRAIERLRARLDAAHGGGRERWLSALAAFAHDPPAPPLVVGGLVMSKQFAALAALAFALVLGLAFARKSATPQSPAAQLARAPAVAPIESSPPDESRSEPADARTAVTVASASSVTASVRVEDLPDPALPGIATPAAGAVVHFSATTMDGSGVKVLLETDARTDAGGRCVFRFDDPGSRPLRMHALARGDGERRTTWSWAFLEKQGEQAVDIAVSRALHGDLEVRVVDINGAPIAGVEVVAQGGQSLHRASVVTAEAPGASGLGYVDSLGALDDSTMERSGAAGTSDEHGLVVFERLGPAEDYGAIHLRTTHPSLELLEVTPLSKRDEGGWNPARMVLAPISAVRVVVEDADGARIAGAGVYLEPAPDEPGSGGALRHAVTDELGVASFQRVCAGQELQVRVGRGDASLAAHGARDGVLEWGERRPGAIPIAASADELLELRAQWPGKFVVRGRVLGVRGDPAADVWVGIDDEASDAESRTDASGAFALELLAAGEPRSVEVRAADGNVALQNFIGWGPVYGSTNAALARVQLDPARDGAWVELSLTQLATISGTVRGETSSPPAGRIRVVPERAAAWGASTAFRSGDVGIDESGRFEIPGLLPGEYDLLAELKEDAFFTSSRIPRRFGPFEAGARDVELAITAVATTRIVVEATAESSAIEAMGVVLVRFHPREPGTDERFRRAELLESVDRPSGWPAQASLRMGGGQSMGSDALAIYECMHLGTKGSRCELPPIGPGTWCIGVKAFARGGRRFALAGTDFLRFGPGDHEVRVRLVEAGEIAGRVLAATPGSELCVQVSDEQGRALAVQGASDRVEAIHATGGSGRFHLRGVPSGSLRLCVGTRAELLAGKPRAEKALELSGGELADVVLGAE